MSRCNRHIVYYFFFFFGVLLQAQDSKNEWENPAILDDSKEEAYAQFVVCHSEKSALSNDRDISTLNQNWNGRWKFNLVKLPSQRSLDHRMKDINHSNFNDIQVRFSSPVNSH